jgi:hypothetical protein
MLLSSILESPRLDHEVNLMIDPRPPMPSEIPSIRELQHHLESAWRTGHLDPIGASHFNGRVIGTNKWIGTTEVATMMLFWRIPCLIVDFWEPRTAVDHLVQWIFSYFSSSNSAEQSNTMLDWTQKHPLYLQYQGHSLTVIGIELMDHNISSLLVFDPSCNGRDIRKIQRNRLKTCQYQLLVVFPFHSTLESFDDFLRRKSGVYQLQRIP